MLLYIYVCLFVMHLTLTLNISYLFSFSFLSYHYCFFLDLQEIFGDLGEKCAASTHVHEYHKHLMWRPRSITMQINCQQFVKI